MRFIVYMHGWSLTGKRTCIPYTAGVGAREQAG
jgi:hypothetical protein